MRVHQIRQLDGSHIAYRPRRFACSECRTTQVFLPAWCLPRPRDSAETVGHALLKAAKGSGHRTIAAELGRLSVGSPIGIPSYGQRDLRLLT